MKTQLKIKDLKVIIDADEVVSEWIKHDYSYYLSGDAENYDLSFNLHSFDYDYKSLPPLDAKKYHDDYIVYETAEIRIIDFFRAGISLFDTKKKHINLYASDIDFLYEIFYMSFESLLGEELDKINWHRVHCLALTQDDRATLLLLPPGAGKSTLALRFLEHKSIKVLAEDMVIYNYGKIHGLHFRWGTRDELYANCGRLMKRKKHDSKFLLDVKKFQLAEQASPHNILLGVRVLSAQSKIKKINRWNLIWPMFKSMVLGLELQQSLAYFLLRNYKDVYIKSKIGGGRIKALISLLIKSQTYVFYIGHDQEKNFNTLEEFVSKK